MKNKTLIAYYSHSGNTRAIAELIQSKTNGTMYGLEPKTSYPSPYDAVLGQARQEIGAGARPELATTISDLDSYEFIFIGTPNWLDTYAPPIATFLDSGDFSGKVLIPFCTHGGGGGGKIEADITSQCPNATVMPALVVQGNGGARITDTIDSWLRKIQFPL